MPLKAILKRAGLAAALIFSVLGAAPPAAPRPALKTGDPAPAIPALRWLKGSPVPGLAKGRIHVVEFWATWCGGCVQVMPHLTELAKTYGDKVTFIGIDVWERGHGNSHRTDTDIDKAVDAFMATRGKTMGYAVAQDTRDGIMARTWLEAAGVMGIPATFLVDAEGRIAMIDHPSRLDEALPQLLAGQSDFQKRPSLILDLK